MIRSKIAPAELIKQLSGPTSDSLARTGDRAVPPDLLREASKRLAIMALLAAVLWVLGTILWHVAWVYLHPGQTWRGPSTPDAVASIAAALSLGLYFFIRHRDRDPDYLISLGLVHMVLMCLGIALVMHVGLPEAEPLQQQVTWIGVIFLMVAAIVPVLPRKMLIAALIGASMGPLVMVATRVHGLEPLAALRIGILMHYADFLLAGVAVIISKVVTRLGQQVTKAREMGSYQLGDLIKRGGMGEVYRATHRMLARPAAIKLIRSEMLGGHDSETADMAVKRFHREAEAAANLRSPHTVELFDFGITEDNTLYFVMEYLDGLDLETLVRNHGPLPPNRVISVLRQTCESLEEAHTQGLIHRDVKPANIHLGKVGIRHDFVKVLDFGLVKSTRGEDTHISLATTVGRTPGTPSYMAPEMALGETVDARADIYALGCVAYFLLTGKLVFDAETTFQMIAKHMRNQPVPPSLRGNVEVPQVLEDLILRCLAKRPEERPESARQLADALGAIRVTPWTDADAVAWWTSRRTSPAQNENESPDDSRSGIRGVPPVSLAASASTASRT